MLDPSLFLFQFENLIIIVIFVSSPGVFNSVVMSL